MGNSHNTTSTECIDCGRIRPRNQMCSGPRCRNCHIKAAPYGWRSIEPEARNRQRSIKPNALPHCPSKRAAWFSPATPSTSMTRICANSSKRQGEHDGR
nr:MAG TPA: hypothetical protein [Caudoviricetes sp.]